MDGSETKLRSSNDSLTEGTDLEAGDRSLILQVKAQAMTIDESTELWVPVKGCPVAIVGLYQHHSGYSIVGHRMLDKQDIFKCKLKPSTVYQKADATFHHWTTDSQRHGLTFLHLSEARKFERLVRKAIKEISPKRGSQSEEEIFVNSDSLLLDCDTSVQSGVPLRPHKPKRLTEEYRLSESSKGSSGKHKNSSSSDEELRSRRGSPLTAAGSVGASQRVKPVTDHNRSNNSSPSSDTSLPARGRPCLSTNHQPTPQFSSQETIISPTTTLATDPLLAAARSNIYVQPGEAMQAEPLPPKGSAATSHKPTALPATAPRQGSQYSDYRTDYYIKTEKKSEEKDKSVTVCESTTTTTETLTQNYSELTSTAEGLSTSNLKCMKNTPPLPRKKKRHRQGMNLCCFSSNQSSLPDEPV